MSEPTQPCLADVTAGPVLPATAVSRWRSLSRRTAVLVTTTLAAVTALAGLGYQPLSWDEAVTLSAARHPPGRLLALLTHTDAPLGGYYLLMHGWVWLAGAIGIVPAEGWLRLPSGLAAVATVALVTKLAADWYGSQAGLLAGALLAVHPLFVFYAHDARPYTLATMLITAATVLLVRAWHRPTVGRIIAYTAVATLAVYAHLFAALVLLVHAGAIAARGPRRAVWAAAGLVGALATVPLIVVGARQTGEIGWIPAPSPAAVTSVLAKVAGGYPMGVAFAGIAIGAIGAIGAVGAIGWRRLSRPTLFVLAWAALTPCLLVAADFLTPVLVARYALVAIPGLVVAAGAAATRTGSRLAAACAVLAVLAGTVTSAVQQAQPYKYEDFRAASDLVGDTAHPGDAVVFVPASTRVGFGRYALGEAGEPAVADVALSRGGAPQGADRIAGDEIAAAAIGPALRPHDRVYLVGVPPRRALGRPATAVDRAKAQALRRGYRLIWTRAFGEVTVTLFARSPTAG